MTEILDVKTILFGREVVTVAAHQPEKLQNQSQLNLVNNQNGPPCNTLQPCRPDV